MLSTFFSLQSLIRVVSNKFSSTSSDLVTVPIIHFNDVYNAEPSTREPVGGAARFVTAVRSVQTEDSMVLFSGDAFSPSMISTLTHGKHICRVLNSVNIDCAVYGNHDFDFGVDNLLKCVRKCKFPWLISNCFEASSGDFLAEGKKWHVIERCGVKFGIIGLVEEEWVATLGTIEPDEVTVTDFCEEGRKLANEMRRKFGCDIIIALTHMRWPNDEKLAMNVPEIDLVLGGHDHDYGVRFVNGTYVIKSGTDFRQFNHLKLLIDRSTKQIVQLDVEEVTIDSSWEEDPGIKSHIDVYMGSLEKKLKKVLTNIEVDLESRFSKIRSEETNLGNLICDIMLTAVDADCSVINSGSLRSDCVFPAGPFTMRDLNNLLPILSPVLVLKLTGRQLLEILENGVSQYPKHEGRFVQVGKISFGFDPNGKPRDRIDPSTVKVDDTPLDLEKDDYRVCVTQYMSTGKDGFDALLDCPVIVDEENGPLLNNAVQNYFMAIRVLNGFKSMLSNYRPRIVNMNKRRHLPNSKWGIVRQSVIEEEERKLVTIAPEKENRIFHIQKHS